MHVGVVIVLIVLTDATCCCLMHTIECKYAVCHNASDVDLLVVVHVALVDDVDAA